MLAGIDNVPNDADCREPREHDAGVVHRAGSYRQGDRHAEEDYRQDDPAHCNSVDRIPECSEREGRFLEVPAPTDHGNEDWKTVRSRQADRGDTGERVEGRGRAEVDQAQEAVDRGGEQDGIDGHIEALVDFAPDAESGDGPVTGKCVGAPAGRRQGANAGEHGNTEDEEQQAEPTTGRASRCLEDEADGLATGHTEEVLHGRQNEENGDQVDETGDTSGDDRKDNCLGDLPMRILHFFTHGCDHAVPRQGVSCLQQTDEESPSRRPKGVQHSRRRHHDD